MKNCVEVWAVIFTTITIRGDETLEGTRCLNFYLKPLKFFQMLFHALSGWIIEIALYSSIQINSSGQTCDETQRKHFPVTEFFQERISYLLLNFSCAIQSLDKSVKLIQGCYGHPEKYSKKAYSC